MLFAYQSKPCEFYIYLGDEISVVEFIVIANEICKNLRGKSLKFKQTLPQKFKQIPSKALNSILLINFCHTDLVLAILINSVILSLWRSIQNKKQNFTHKTCISCVKI